MSNFVSKLKWMAKQRATGLLRLSIGMVASMVGVVWLFEHAPPVFYGLLLIGFACGIWAFGFEPRFVRRRHFVRTIRGPKAERPLRLAILGDLHVGAPHFGRQALENLVERLSEEDADAMILVGDYVIQEVLGGRPVPIEETAEILRKTELPIIAVLGNHDSWGDNVRIRGALESIGAIVLENAHHVLTIEGVPFCVVGLEDESTGNPDPLRAFPDTMPEGPLLVLAHDPATFLTKKMPLGGDLLLSGHTHGGQVRLPWIGALVVPGRSPLAWSHGWSETKGGPLYVTSGLGTSLLPMRFLAPPEYVILDLVLSETGPLGIPARKP